MACIVITVSSPYHYAMKARKPQSPKRESAAISGIGVCKRTVITRCGISPSPFFSCRVGALYLLRFLVILDAGLSQLEGRRPRLVPPAFLFRPSIAQDGQNLPLGVHAGIDCYLASHIWLESAHTPIAGEIPINKEDPWASTVERPPSSQVPVSRH